MSDSDPPKTNTAVTLSADQFAELMRLSMSQKPQPQQPSSTESLGEVRRAEKLNGDNYPLWAKLMSRAIRGKGLASHINGVPDPLPQTDPNYNWWQQRDDCCFNWIINNIDASLVNEVSQYETAYDLWDSLATMYGSGVDQFQISDLHRQAYNIKQGESSLESLWQKLQDLWISIDTRDPNPMDGSSSIEKYNQVIQRHRLYQFIWALDDKKYSKIKREILNMDPIPTTRNAYGLVRRESVNEKLLNPEGKESGIGSGLAVYDRNRTPQHHHHQSRNSNYSRDEDKSKLVCNHCGGKKHTRETCFHIHGFPEWWDEMKKARQAQSVVRTSGGRGGGRASAAIAQDHGNTDRASYAENPTGGSGGGGISGSSGEVRTEEKGPIASVSMAQTWTEGNTLPIGEFADEIVDGSNNRRDGEAARVPTGNKGMAAEVSPNPIRVIQTNVPKPSPTKLIIPSRPPLPKFLTNSPQTNPKLQFDPLTRKSSPD